MREGQWMQSRKCWEQDGADHVAGQVKLQLYIIKKKTKTLLEGFQQKNQNAQFAHTFGSAIE